MQKRSLTVNLQRSVSGTAPVVMEVAINPLSSPSSPNQDVTLVGRETQDVLLTNGVNPVVFELVPTDHPDLTERITYRIAWREKFMGRLHTSDFVMPDFDVDFDDLTDLGLIIGGETYLQWSDRGNPGGVAGLNDRGQVLDADGNIVSGDAAASVVQSHLDVEIVDRQTADNYVRSFLLSHVSDQIGQVYASTASSIGLAVSELQTADVTERAQRIAAVAALNVLLGDLESETNVALSVIDEALDTLVDKADLVGGKVPSSQLPDLALGKAIPVDDEEEMLALTTSQVQPGDFVVRPDGVFFLNENPPSDIDSWVAFQVNATVLSVNSQIGAVILSAADVGARSSATSIPQADVTGLPASLDAKADASVTTAINTRLQTIENDTTLVRTSAGVVPKALMGEFMAFLNEDGQVTRKDGTVLNVGGGGGDLDIEDVVGLPAALAGKLESSDPSVTDARTPLNHAASHQSGGSDPLTLATSQITGLVAILTNNGLTSSANHENRIQSLELGGGGGGGGGDIAKAAWFDGTTEFADVESLAEFQDVHNVLLKGPFSVDATGDYYTYSPGGVAPIGDTYLWPYITPGGHLELRAWDESAAADSPPATLADLDALSAVDDTKADQSDLDDVVNAMGDLATEAALTDLSNIVDAKAEASTVTTLTDTVSNKADQSEVDTLSAAVADKAEQADLAALTTTVGTKAATSVVTAIDTRLTTVESSKASQAALTALTTTVSSKASQADLTALITTVSGKAATSVVTAIDTRLTTVESGKADLVGGKVSTDQLPALSFMSVHAVASRPALLALTTSQVQPGDVGIITATVDKGNYILSATDPSVFSNWVKLTAPDDTVTSVNGITGTVVLSASDVGARSSSTPILQTEVNGLGTALGSKADAATMTSALATKTSTTDVQTLLSAASPNKQRADYVATTPVASLAGLQSIDGVLMSVGSIVLLTAQSSSVNNGLWVVGSSSWTRATDMPAAAYFVKGTQVIVASGAANSNTIWLETAASGLVGTNANNWTKVLTAGVAPSYTAVNGVQKISNEFSVKVAAGGGILAESAGLRLDSTLAVRKYSVDVPSGSTTATITHGLNSTDVGAFFRDKVTGDAVLVGWRPTGVNTISAEFATPPASGQFRCVVVG